jgi:hypothetical protein
MGLIRTKQELRVQPLGFGVMAREHTSRPAEALLKNPEPTRWLGQFRASPTDTGSDRHCAWGDPAAQIVRGLPVKADPFRLQSQKHSQGEEPPEG